MIEETVIMTEETVVTIEETVTTIEEIEEIVITIEMVIPEIIERMIVQSKLRLLKIWIKKWIII